MTLSGKIGDFKLVDMNTGKQSILPYNKTTYTCGRLRTNNITTSSAIASRKHCSFVRVGTELCVVDFRSTNGIFINGQIQQQNVMIPLKSNDLIGLGHSHILPSSMPWPGGVCVLKYLE